MPCYRPIDAYRSRYKNHNGKQRITFNRADSAGIKITLPCGQCIGCRLERSRQWAIRCTHEAQMHDDNSFITLTYNDENLPDDGSLKPKHFQDFMKRLRKHYAPKKIRYYHCGEYGELLSRPHYHACLFGLDFVDKKYLKTQKNGTTLFTSATLEKIWTFGFSTIGTVTFESAAYVARYILKKINGERSEQHYKQLSEDTGELTDLHPEYTTMSRKPGLGSTWYETYGSDIYPNDTVVINGRKMKPPRYYDQKYEICDPEAYEKLKTKRKEEFENIESEDQSPERLLARENFQHLKNQRFERNLKD